MAIRCRWADAVIVLVLLLHADGIQGLCVGHYDSSTLLGQHPLEAGRASARPAIDDSGSRQPIHERAVTRKTDGNLANAPPVHEAQMQCATSLALPLTLDECGRKLVLIPPGSFEFGPSTYDRLLYEHSRLQSGAVTSPAPLATTVHITRPFYLAAYETTVDEWSSYQCQSYVSNAQAMEGAGRPQGGISWLEAMDYCYWLSRTTGRIYRLPTEAEWEWACRAMTMTRWSCGNDESALPRFAVFSALPGQRQGPSRVGLKLPNPFGLFDMHGNMAEFCMDCYSPYLNREQWNPVQLRRKSPWRIARGGDYTGCAPSIESRFRLFFSEDNRLPFNTVRVVREAHESE